MRFRCARHTNNLNPIIAFYRDMLGLTILGEFREHDGYDGVFLGLLGIDWHLEFTTSTDAAVHKPDEEDLLVFYPASAEEFNAIIKRFSDNKIAPVAPKNPYWNVHGITYADPDGYRIVIVRPDGIII